MWVWLAGAVLSGGGGLVSSVRIRDAVRLPRPDVYYQSVGDYSASVGEAVIQVVWDPRSCPQPAALRPKADAFALWSGVPPRGSQQKRALLVYASPESFWLPSADLHADWGLVSLPVWIPTAVFTLAAAWSWWRSRGYPPGHCRRCGYNLTGNASGRCPECGTPSLAPGES
jgi:hypothetical protein